MKLKKIASLALAGVMAVSMLTACGEGNTIDDNKTPNEPDTTPVAGYSDVFDARLGASISPKIDMADSANLNAALQAAMKFASDVSVDWAYDNTMNAGKVMFVSPRGGNTSVKQVAVELINAADNHKESLVSYAETDCVKLLNPNFGFQDKTIKPIAYDEQKADIVMLFVASGLDANAAVNEVADMLKDDINELVGYYNLNGTHNNTMETEYDYSGSVSADTITLDADHGKSMTFVAVEIVREIV